MKKTVSILLSLLILLSVFMIIPFSVSATESIVAETGASSGTTGDCTWTLDDNGVLTISGNGSMEDSYSDSKPPWYSEREKINTVIIENGVTNISDSAFDSYSYGGYTRLTSVIIPDSVIKIGDSVFYGCTGLTSISIPDSITSIGEWTFFGCTGLTEILIPSYVTSIGRGAFFGCTGLTSAIIPDSVTSIGDSAFEYCSGLTSIKIPSSVTSIGDYAFEECTRLRSLTIPDYVNNIGESVFSNCFALSDVNLYIKDIESFCSGSIIKRLFDGKRFHLFMNGELITNIVIPDLYASLNDNVFSYCSDIISIRIPKHLREISCGAFYGCTNLTSIKVDPENRYFDSRDNCNAIIEKNSNKLLIGCSTTTIPDTVTSISDRAFSGCTRLRNLTIPDSVTSISERAFSGCTGLTSITIGNYVNYIARSSFFGCTSLKRVTIPQSVTYIGENAFGYYRDNDNSYKKIEGFTIYGYEGSVADDYAWDNIFDFVELMDISNWNVSGIKNKTYTGKAIKQSITVKKGTKKATVSVKYKNNTNAGKATAIITGTGNYTGTITKTFMISKAKNPMTLGYKKSVTANSKKKTTIKKAVTANKAQGKVTYKTNNKKVTVKNGTMTVAKGLKKGKTISVKVKVTAKGNSNYKSASKSVTVKVKVK